MPSLADRELTYLRSLGFPGSALKSINDLRFAYLSELCQKSDNITQLILGTVNDLAEAQGVAFPFLGNHASKNFYTEDKMMVNLAAWPLVAGSNGAVTLTVDGTAPVPTTNCVTVTSTAAAATAPRCETLAAIPCTPGCFYTISGYGRQIVGAVKRQARLDLRWLDKDGVTITTQAGNKNTTTLGVWQRYVGNDNLAPANARTLKVRIGLVNADTGDAFRWCGLMVEKGNWDETTPGKVVGAYV